MKPELFMLLLQNLREFFEREDVADELGDFYWGEDTELFIARSIEATYNAMAHAAKMEKTQGEAG